MAAHLDSPKSPSTAPNSSRIGKNQTCNLPFHGQHHKATTKSIPGKKSKAQPIQISYYWSNISSNSSLGSIQFFSRNKSRPDLYPTYSPFLYCTIHSKRNSGKERRHNQRITWRKIPERCHIRYDNSIQAQQQFSARDSLKILANSQTANVPSRPRLRLAHPCFCLLLSMV